MTLKFKICLLLDEACSWAENLSLEPILEPVWRRLVKLFETVTPPSKRMEKQTTPYMLARRHATNRFLLNRKSPEPQ